jgi:mono/diheme cytochrome c family protein
MKKLLFFFAATLFVIGCQSKTDDASTESTTSSNESSTPKAADNSMSPSGEGAVTFASIEPVIKDNCVKCHGEKPAGGIDLRTHESVMKGGEDGPIVKAGDPENSVLVQALRGTHGKKMMPLKAKPLAEDIIQKVEAWIKGGAKA